LKESNHGALKLTCMNEGNQIDMHPICSHKNKIPLTFLKTLVSKAELTKLKKIKPESLSCSVCGQ
jgi:hypothetical protein